jgi:hypothetical protein
LFRETVAELVGEHFLSQESIEHFATFFVGSCTDAPDEGKDEQWVNASY